MLQLSQDQDAEQRVRGKTMRAVYAGTFDPVTVGHLSVIRRAAIVFGSVAVLIAENPAKRPLFSLAERLELLHEALTYCNIRNAYPMYTRLYVAEWCQYGDVLVRGIRDVTDLASEDQIAAFNRNPHVEKEKGRTMYPAGLETVWLPAEDSHISSSSAKLLAYNDDPTLAEAVVPPVAKALKLKVKR